MKIKHLYLLLFLVGTALPLSQFYGFFIVYGLDVNAFFEQLFVNKISSFFAMDVFVSAAVTVTFILYKTRDNNIKYSWACFVALFLAGVSSALPLFLFLLEQDVKKPS